MLDRDAAALTHWLVTGKGKARVHFTETLEDSMKINSIRSGAVIISASGMCEGGRIKHHLRYNISRPECAIVFVGFQAAGTLGRRIVDGAKTVRLFGEQHAVRAKVYTIGGLSAHADRDALLGWLGGFGRPPRATWVVHGEPLAAHALRDEIEQAPRVARSGADGASDGDAGERRVNGHPGAGWRPSASTWSRASRVRAPTRP